LAFVPEWGGDNIAIVVTEILEPHAALPLRAELPEQIVAEGVPLGQAGLLADIAGSNIGVELPSIVILEDIEQPVTQPVGVDRTD